MRGRGGNRAAKGREIGHNLYAWSFTHTMKVDPQDSTWGTDKGSDYGA
jgi:hypothetical protein